MGQLCCMDMLFFQLVYPNLKVVESDTVNSGMRTEFPNLYTYYDIALNALAEQCR